MDSEKSDNSKNIIKNASNKSIPPNLMDTQIKEEEFYYGEKTSQKIMMILIL